VSRAFVSEDAADANAAMLPERPVSDAPNLVTPRGLELIDAEIARLQQAHASTAPGDAERAIADRDLRYWRARRSSASVVPPPAGPPDAVAFGCLVTLRRATGGMASYRIVGEDEADPPAGLLAWTSPLATALMGARAGDEVEVGSGRPSVVVQSVE